MPIITAYVFGLESAVSDMFSDMGIISDCSRYRFIFFCSRSYSTVLVINPQFHNSFSFFRDIYKYNEVIRTQFGV